MNSKFNPELAQRWIALCRQNPNTDVLSLARAVGITTRTAQRWLSRGAEAKRGQYYEMFIALQRARAELLAAVRGRHMLHAQGGVLRAPKKKVFIDDHGRPFESRNNEVEYEFEGGDPNCPHERRLAEHPEMCATCQAVGHVVFVDKVVEPNIGAMEFEINRLDPMVAPAQQHEHRVSGRVELEHTQAPPAEWIERLGAGFAILAEAHLHPSFMDRTLGEYAASVPGSNPKMLSDLRAAIKKVADGKTVETTATAISDVTDYWIELEKDGTWHRVGEQQAHAPENACRGFLNAFCAGKFPDEPERAKKYAIQLLSKVRAVPKRGLTF